MCGKTKVWGHTVLPGDFTNITLKGDIVHHSRFGFAASRGPDQYNVRVENLSSAQRGKRAILEVEGFYEKYRDKEYFFCMPNGVPTLIAVTYNDKFEFAIITKPARQPVISVHSRQPVIVGDEKKWLAEGIIKPPEETLIKEAV